MTKIRKNKKKFWKRNNNQKIALRGQNLSSKIFFYKNFTKISVTFGNLDGKTYQIEGEANL